MKEGKQGKESKHIRPFSMPLTPACPALMFASSTFSFAVSAADLHIVGVVLRRRDGRAVEREMVRVLEERRAAGRRRNDILRYWRVGVDGN